MAGASQCAALALQKVTVPGWTATPLAVTWAVRVRVVPRSTEVEGETVRTVWVVVACPGRAAMLKVRERTRGRIEA
jgi:hypothetical protein